MRLTLFPFFILLFSFTTPAQTTCEVLEKQIDNIYDQYYFKDPVSLITAIETLLPAMDSSKCAELIITAYLYYMEDCALHHDAFGLSKTLLEKTDEILEQYQNQIPPVTADFCNFYHQNNYGNFYYKQGRFQEAENHYLTFLKKYDPSFDNDTKNIFIAAHQFLAKIYQKQLRLLEAEQVLRKALEIAKPIGEAKLHHSYKLLADVLTAIAEKSPIQENKRLIEARSHYQKALNGNVNDFENNGKQIPADDSGIINRIIHTYLGVARLDIIEGKRKQAEQKENEVNDLLKRVKTNLLKSEQYLKYDDSQERYLLETSGDLKQLEGDYLNAIGNYQRTLDSLTAQGFNKNHPQVASIYLKIGACYLEEQNFFAAKENFNKIEKSLSENDFSFMAAHALLIQLNKLKGDYYYKIYNGNTNVLGTENIADLKIAFTHYQQTITYLQELKLFHSDEDKANTLALYDKVFDRLVKIAYQLGEEYWALAFSYAEQAKAVKLQATLSHIDALKLSNVSSGNQEKEINLRIAIANLNKQLKRPLEKEQYQQSLEKLRVNEQKLQTLLTSYRIDDAIYFNQYYKQDTVNIQKIRSQLLDANTALIEYHFTDEHLYAWWLTANEFEMYQITMPDLEIVIDKLYDLMVNDEKKLYGASFQNNLYQFSYELYQPLLGKFPFNSSIENLIIIPDKVIKKVPFDILSKEPFPNYLEPSQCLISKYAINYNHSATILLKQNNLQASPHKYALGAFINKGINPPLQNIQNTLTYIAKSHTFLNVTPKQFLEKINLYNVIAIGAHTKIDFENPYYSSLILHNEIKEEQSTLTFIELQSLRLSTKLAIILSCEAARDDIKMRNTSLADAFNYAGVKNFIAPLWKAPDVHTAEITKYLYQFLKKGYNSPQALRKAKLTYLEKYYKGDKENDMALHPFFWATLVHYGDDKVIYEPSWLEKILMHLGRY